MEVVEDKHAEAESDLYFDACVVWKSFINGLRKQFEWL